MAGKSAVQWPAADRRESRSGSPSIEAELTFWPTVAVELIEASFTARFVTSQSDNSWGVS